MRVSTIPPNFASSFMEYKRDGHNGRAYLTDVLGLNGQLADSISSEWKKNIEDESLLVFDTLYEETISILLSIHETSIRVVYLTVRNNRKCLNEELVRLRIRGYADEVIVLSQGTGKTDELIRIRNISDDVIVVGDTETDYDAAMAASVRCYILNRGFRSKAYWDRRGVNSDKNLSEIIEKIKKDSKKEA